MLEHQERIQGPASLHWVGRAATECAALKHREVSPSNSMAEVRVVLHQRMSL